MTIGVGDVCLCGDIAAPGQVERPGCIADRQAERSATAAVAQELTAAAEALVEDQDEVVA